MDAAWVELEQNPVFEAYNDGPLHLQCDQAREQVAGLLGCRSGELLITRSTTDAMNVLASLRNFTPPQPCQRATRIRCGPLRRAIPRHSLNSEKRQPNEW